MISDICREPFRSTRALPSVASLINGSEFISVSRRAPWSIGMICGKNNEVIASCSKIVGYRYYIRSHRILHGDRLIRIIEYSVVVIGPCATFVLCFASGAGFIFAAREILNFTYPIATRVLGCFFYIFVRLFY